MTHADTDTHSTVHTHTLTMHSYLTKQHEQIPNTRPTKYSNHHMRVIKTEQPELGEWNDGHILSGMQPLASPWPDPPRISKITFANPRHSQCFLAAQFRAIKRLRFLRLNVPWKGAAARSWTGLCNSGDEYNTFKMVLLRQAIAQNLDCKVKWVWLKPPNFAPNYYSQ